MTVGLNYRPKVGGSFRSLSSHGPAAVEVTAAELLECMKRPLPESGGAEALLRQFRRLEKGEA